MDLVRDLCDAILVGLLPEEIAHNLAFLEKTHSFRLPVSTPSKAPQAQPMESQH